MTPLIKSILAAMLAIIIPLIYTSIVDASPGFPIPELSFSETIMWAVGLLIGGWNIAKGRVEFLRKLNLPASESDQYKV